MKYNKRNASEHTLFKLYVALIGICMSGFFGFDKYMPFHELLFIDSYIHMVIFAVNILTLLLLIQKKRKLKIYNFSHLCVSWIVIIFVEIIYTYFSYHQPIYHTFIEAMYMINPFLSLLCFCQFSNVKENEDIFVDILVKISVITSTVSTIAFVFFTYFNIDILRLGSSAVIRNDTVRIATGTMLVQPVIMISIARFIEKEHKKIDIYNIVLGLLNIVLIAKTRMVLLGVVMTILLYILVKRNLNRGLKSVIIVLLIILGLFSMLSLSTISNSITAYLNADYGIQRRFNEIDFYFKQFINHPILGMGLLSGSKGVVNSELLFGPYGVYYRNDVGIVGIINAYGIVGILWLIYFFKIMITNGLKNKENSNLLVSVLYILTTIITLSFLDAARSMYMFIIFALWFCMKNRKSHSQE